MGKLLLSAFADEYAVDIDSQLDMLKSESIDYIEPRFINGKNISSLEKTEVLELKSKLKLANIGISAIGSPLGKIKLDDDYDAHLELSRRTFETAAELGARYVRVFSFYPRAGVKIGDSRAEVIEKLGGIVDLADEFGLCLCHENEANIYGESPEACLDLLSVFSGRLKAVFDMGNFTLGKYDPASAYRMMRDYVEYFHIKDALKAGAIVPPGLGEAHIAEILNMHKRSTRDVFVTLEPHLETFSGLNRLTDVSFDNPYKFENKETAFLFAVGKIKEILGEK